MQIRFAAIPVLLVAALAAAECNTLEINIPEDDYHRIKGLLRKANPTHRYVDGNKVVIRVQFDNLDTIEQQINRKTLAPYGELKCTDASITKN